MNVAINLAVDDASDFKATMAKAQRKGLKVTQMFDDLGVASGVIDTEKLDGLRRLEGVIVEEDRAASI